MRCLILIALCFVLANATYYNKNRFQRLLNRYQNRFQNEDWDNEMNTQNLYGSDDVDDHIQDYIDEIRRERNLGRNQCPRDTDDILDLNRQSWYNQENEPWYNQESDFDTRFGEEDLEEQGFGGQRYGRQHFGRRGLGQRGLGHETFGQQGFGQQGWYGNENEDEEIGQSWFGGEEDIESSWMGRQSPLMGQRDQLEHPVLSEITLANTKLASRLYKQIKDERDDKNTVVSPLSIQLALAALNNGARGNTKRQIGRVVAGSLPQHQRRQVFRTLVRHLKGFGQQSEYSSIRGSGITKINPVTGIFITHTTRAQRQFVQIVKGTLGATVKQCPFHRQPQQCRQMINQWVSQKTHHKINKIVPQDGITDNTKMILVNALELKTRWGPQMRRCHTKQAKFYPLETNKPKTVQVLETQGRFKYYEDELTKIVGIPTEQKKLTLYVVVPKEKDGLTEVEKLHLQDGVQLKELLKTCDRHVRHVGVQLPKFQIKHKVDVRRTLRKQGVTDAFDPQRADFSGITGVGKFDMEENDEIYGQHWMKYRRNPFLNRFNPQNNYGNDMETEYGMGGMGMGMGGMGMGMGGMGMGMENIEGMGMGGMDMEEIGGTTEHKLHLNKFIHQTVIKITQEGITATTGSGIEEFESRMGGRHGGLEGGMGGMDEEFGHQGIYGQELNGQKVVKANHAFAFVLKHNPTNQVVLVGRVIDAAQKKVNFVPQTINAVDQF